jgi:predicted MFS family arabinose efflux permease
MAFPAVVAAFCGDLVGAAQASTAIGFTNVFFAAGQALGPVAGGMVIDATGSVPVALIGSAALSVLGAAGTFLIRRAPMARRARA